MSRPGNQHCTNGIGTLSFPIILCHGFGGRRSLLPLMWSRHLAVTSSMRGYCCWKVWFNGDRGVRSEEWGVQMWNRRRERERERESESTVSRKSTQKCRRAGRQPTGSRTFRTAPMFSELRRFAYLVRTGAGRRVLFCSLAVLDPRVGHTMDVLSPFISVLCHSDWLFHGESCPRLDVVLMPACAWHCSLHYLFIQGM